MKKFEYMRVAINATEIPALEKQLNYIGNDGWEAFFVDEAETVSDTMRIEYWYFKREKQQ